MSSSPPPRLKISEDFLRAEKESRDVRAVLCQPMKAKIGPRTSKKCSIETSLQIISLQWKLWNHRCAISSKRWRDIAHLSRKYVPRQITLSAVNEEKFDGNVNKILINYWGQRWKIFLQSVEFYVCRISNKSIRWIENFPNLKKKPNKNCPQNQKINF